jgi:GT2 family glycosyltransferase
MNNPIQVSVVVPSYGRPDRIRRLLGNLFEQKCDFKYEIIVVDDGSPEPIEPTIPDLLERSPVPIKCARKENGGPASARNHGAKIATGEYVIFIDDDMSVPPDLLQAHIDSQREVGGGFINCMFKWQIDSPSKSFTKWYSRQTDTWVAALHKDLESNSGTVFKAEHASSLTGCNLSVKREDYLRLGGIDEEYEHYGCEDQDLGLRAGKIGINIYHSNKSMPTHLEWHNSFKSFCHRQLIGAIDTVRFVKRFAVVENNWNAPHVEAFGYVQFGKDPALLIVKKLLRSLVILPGVLQLAFGVIKILEAVAPNSYVLFKFYDLLVAAHIQKGWRMGLKRYSDVKPLPGWEPKLEV